MSTNDSQTGHNSQLQSIVERIEHIDGEIKDLRDGQKEVFTEAKSNGWDVKVLRKVIALRKMDPADRAEQETLLETYMSALGTP